MKCPICNKEMEVNTLEPDFKDEDQKVKYYIFHTCTHMPDQDNINGHEVTFDYVGPIGKSKRDAIAKARKSLRDIKLKSAS
jgi:hypothetical protein